MLIDIVQKVRVRGRLTRADHPGLVDALPAHVHGQRVRHIIGKAAAGGGVVDDELAARAALIPGIAQVQAVARSGKARSGAEGLGAGRRLVRNDNRTIGKNFNAITAVGGPRAVAGQQGLGAGQRIAAHGPGDIERAAVQLESGIGEDLDEVIVPVENRPPGRSRRAVQIDTVLGAVSKSTVAGSRVSVIEVVKRENRHVVILVSTGPRTGPNRPDAPLRHGNRSAQGPTAGPASCCLLPAESDDQRDAVRGKPRSPTIL